MKILSFSFTAALAIGISGCAPSANLSIQPGVGDDSAGIFGPDTESIGAAADARLRRQGLTALRGPHGRLTGYRSYSYGRGHGFGTSYSD